MDLTSPPLQQVKGVVHGAKNLSIREDPNNAFPRTPPQSPQSRRSNTHDRAIVGAAVVWQLTPLTSPPSPVLGSNHDEDTTAVPPASLRQPVQETLPLSISPTACLQCVLANLPCSATHPTCTRCARRLRLAASPLYPSPTSTAFGSTPCLAQRKLISSEGKGRGSVLCSCTSCRDIGVEEDDWMAIREDSADAVSGGMHNSAAWLWAPKGAGKGWMNWRRGD